MQERRQLHAKTTRVKLYINMEMGARDLHLTKHTHGVRHIPLWGIFIFKYHSVKNRKIFTEESYNDNFFLGNHI